MGQLVPLAFDERDLGTEGYAEKRIQNLMQELKEGYERSETEFAKHRELLKQGKKDPKDLEILLESIATQRQRLDDQEKLARDSLAKLTSESDI